MDSLAIVLTNALTEVPRAVARVEVFCASHSVPARIVHRFTLVLDEVLTNVITHAFPDGCAHEIAVQVDCRGGALTAAVRDDGAPFDPLSQPPPDVRAPVEDRKVGGLGIHLVRSLMDDVAYRREGGRNCLAFRTRVGLPKT